MARTIVPRPLRGWVVPLVLLALWWAAVRLGWSTSPLLVAPRIRGAKGATSMRSQHGLPAVRGSRPSSARCQPSAGRAAGAVAAAAAASQR